jgi:ArsR family transcriptional regulator, lead/cadmium/zinc/bismuth-responsive transcriptional repressor
MQVLTKKSAELSADHGAHTVDLASVAAALIGVEEAAGLAEMFRLLGDPTRVRILFALLEAGELCVCDLARAVETSETKVSQAMRLLRGAGVVRNRRDGRNIFYRLQDSHVRLILDLSREHLSHAELGAVPDGR